MSADTLQVRCLIKGRVQGVGYRAWTKRVADELGLRGWVKNFEDGDVAALFHGPPERVREMLERCHTGPVAANVTQVAEVKHGPEEDEERSALADHFEIILP